MMKPRYFIQLLFVFIAEVAFGQNVMSWNFDWDDNIFYMPTKVILFDSEDRDTTVRISTREFAVVRDYLKDGVMMGGPYLGYGIDQDRARGTFRYFGDEGFEKDVNIFQRHFERAWAEDFQSNKGPAWDAFVAALSTESTASWTTIITARGHEPESIYATLVGLQKRKVIKYLPRLEHIFPVTNAKFGEESSRNPSGAKVLVQFSILDEIDALGLDNTMHPVLDQDGLAKTPLHVWGFSDDDWGNYEKTRDILGKEVSRGRWPNVKIVLFFTGKNNPEHKPESTVIRMDGTLRRLNQTELMEIARVAFQKEEIGLELIPD